MTATSNRRPRRSSSAAKNRGSTSGVSASTSDLRREDSSRDHVDVAPRVRRLDARLEHRLDQAVALRRAHAGLQPPKHAAEADEADAVATLEVAGRERRCGSHRLLEHAPVGAAHIGEAVDEEHDVGVALGVALVDDEPLPTGGCAPVDRAHAVAGHEVADVRVLDAVALAPRDLAARERLRLHRREESAQRDRARVRLEADATSSSVSPRSRAGTRRARARSTSPELVDAPASCSAGRTASSRSSPAREPQAASRARRRRPPCLAGARAGARRDPRTAARADGHDCLDLAPLERPLGVERELGLDARVAARAFPTTSTSANGAATIASSGRRSASAPTMPIAASAA